MLAAPRNVTVSNYSATQQRVSWSGGGPLYRLYVSVNGGSFTGVTISGQTYFPYTAVFINCTAGQRRQYRVVSSELRNGSLWDWSEGADSNVLVFQPPGGGYVPPDPHDPTPPVSGGSSNPPTGLKITSLSDTSIKLSWTNNGSYAYLVGNVQVNGCLLYTSRCV